MSTLHRKNHHSNLNSAASPLRSVVIKAGECLPTPKNTHLFHRKPGSRKNSQVLQEPAAIGKGNTDPGLVTGNVGPVGGRSGDVDPLKVVDGPGPVRVDVLGGDHEIDEAATGVSSNMPASRPGTTPHSTVPTGDARKDLMNRPLPQLPQLEDDTGKGGVTIEEADGMSTSSFQSLSIATQNPATRPSIKRSRSENESVSSATNHSATLEWVLEGPRKHIAELEAKVAEQQRKIAALESNLRNKDATFVEREGLIRTQAKTLSDGDAKLADQNDRIHGAAERTRRLEKLVRERDNTLNSQQVKLNEQLNQIYAQNERARTQKVQMQEKDKHIGRLDDSIKDQNLRLEAQAQRLQDVDRAHKKAVVELARLSQQGRVYKVDDDDLIARYDRILYLSRNWTTTYCGTDGGRTSFEVKEIEGLKVLTPEYLVYLQSTTLRPVLMQSCIMHSLWNEVLSKRKGGGLVWAGDFAESLGQLDRALRPGEINKIPALLRSQDIRAVDVKEYCAWKAKAALLLSEHVDEAQVDMAIDDVTEQLRSDLEPFITMKGLGMWEELRDIIVEAVDLDEEVHKLKAAFSISKTVGPERSRWGFGFNDANMESAAGFDIMVRAGSPVELIVAPFFLKVGTADGDAYDKFRYLCKCVVVCTEARKQLVK